MYDDTMAERTGGVHHRIKMMSDAKVNSTDFTVASLLVGLVLAYTVFSMIQGLINFSLTQLIGAALILTLFYDFINHLTRLKVFSLCMLCVSASLCMGIFTLDLSRETEFFTYLSSTLLFLVFISRKSSVPAIQAVLKRWSLPVTVCLWFCSLMALYALITGAGYSVSWGGESYFIGFTSSEHTMASISCLVMTLSYFIFKGEHFGKIPVLLIYVLFTFIIFKTGARTFLIPVAILWVLFVNDEKVVSQHWLRVILMVMLVGSALVAFGSSAMANKFDYASSLNGYNGGSQLDNLSSGRLDIWRVDLAAFADSGLIGQVFGNSASFVYTLNYQTFYLHIWAHDDFIMVLCSAGYVGLITYISALAMFFNGLKPLMRRWCYWALLAYVLFPAVINGFYSYQHFMYSAMLLACALAFSRRSGKGDLYAKR